MVKSVKGHLDLFADSPHEEKPTIAVLVPRNQRGVEVVESLRKRGVEAIELISSTANTRAAAGSLNYLLSYLADPQSARKLSKAYEVFRRDWREDVEKMELVKGVGDLIRRVGEVEKFIAPNQADDWLSTVGEGDAVKASLVQSVHRAKLDEPCNRPKQRRMLFTFPIQHKRKSKPKQSEPCSNHSCRSQVKVIGGSVELTEHSTKVTGCQRRA